MRNYLVLIMFVLSGFAYGEPFKSIEPTHIPKPSELSTSCYRNYKFVTGRESYMEKSFSYFEPKARFSDDNTKIEWPNAERENSYLYIPGAIDLVEKFDFYYEYNDENNLVARVKYPEACVTEVVLLPEETLRNKNVQLIFALVPSPKLINELIEPTNAYSTWVKNDMLKIYNDKNYPASSYHRIMGGLIDKCLIKERANLRKEIEIKTNQSKETFANNFPLLQNIKGLKMGKSAFKRSMIKLVGADNYNSRISSITQAVKEEEDFNLWYSLALYAEQAGYSYLNYQTIEIVTDLVSFCMNNSWGTIKEVDPTDTLAQQTAFDEKGIFQRTIELREELYKAYQEKQEEKSIERKTDRINKATILFSEIQIAYNKLYQKYINDSLTSEDKPSVSSFMTKVKEYNSLKNIKEGQFVDFSRAVFPKVFMSAVRSIYSCDVNAQDAIAIVNSKFGYSLPMSDDLSARVTSCQQQLLSNQPSQQRDYIPQYR